MTNELQILQETEDFIAVLKPPGWLTIPGRGHKEGVPILSHVVGAILRDRNLIFESDPQQ